MAQGYKTGGRQAGTPNKITKELRGLISELVQRQLKAIGEVDSEDWNRIPTGMRISLVSKLLPYAMPRCTSDDEGSGW